MSIAIFENVGVIRKKIKLLRISISKQWPYLSPGY